MAPGRVNKIVNNACALVGGGALKKLQILMGCEAVVADIAAMVEVDMVLL